jgi:hypothetical protein
MARGEGKPAPAKIQQQVQALVKKHGLVATASKLGVTFQTLVRVVNGLGVRPNTVAAVTKRLAVLGGKS